MRSEHPFRRVVPRPLAHGGPTAGQAPGLAGPAGGGRRLGCHQIPVMPSHLPGPDHRGMEPRRHVLGPVTVSRVGFGAMQLPGPGVFGPPRGRAAAIAVVRRAVELGVDHVGTARYCGPGVANELIRAALHPYPAGLALVSKVGARRDASGGVLRYDQPAELQPGRNRGLPFGQLREEVLITAR
jgi:hypothetical protein